MAGLLLSLRSSVCDSVRLDVLLIAALIVDNGPWLELRDDWSGLFLLERPAVEEAPLLLAAADWSLEPGSLSPCTLR